MPEHQNIKQSRGTRSFSERQIIPAKQVHASNSTAIIQRARIDPKSLTSAEVLQLQHTIGNGAVGRLLSGIRNSSTVQQVPVQRQEISEEEETCPSCVQKHEIQEEKEPLQGMFENKPEKAMCSSCVQRQEIPREEEYLQMKKENNTGMPDNLKAGVESLSGIDLSDVRVHYNSSKPAEIGALAYTQGTDIHVAPGQERHLPHEAWHVVQQARGRVRPTFQTKGLAVNDNIVLEKEADEIEGNITAKDTGRNIKLEKLDLKNQIPVIQGYFTYKGSRLTEKQLDIVLQQVNDSILLGFTTEKVGKLLQYIQEQSLVETVLGDIITYLSNKTFLTALSNKTFLTAAYESIIGNIERRLEESDMLSSESDPHSIFSGILRINELGEVACFYIENRLLHQNGIRSKNYGPSPGCHAEENMCREIVDPYLEIDKKYSSSGIKKPYYINIYIYSTYSPCYYYTAPGSTETHNCCEFLSNLIIYVPNAKLFLGYKYIWEGTTESTENKREIIENSEQGIRFLENNGFTIIKVP